MDNYILSLMEKCEEKERYKIGIFTNNQNDFNALICIMSNIATEKSKWRIKKECEKVNLSTFNGSYIDFVLISDDINSRKTYNEVIVDGRIDSEVKEHLKARAISFYNYDTGIFENANFEEINF